MNNSKALQDDNGKLEVRLCMACACVRLVASFQPGGNCKGHFIHMNYVNKVTLLFKGPRRGRVTACLSVSGRWSNDYRPVVLSTISTDCHYVYQSNAFFNKKHRRKAFVL